ncbi:MAG: hypothetical protein Q9162_002316 [Coniocarpon cinnabarinum]
MASGPTQSGGVWPGSWNGLPGVQGPGQTFNLPSTALAAPHSSVPGSYEDTIALCPHLTGFEAHEKWLHEIFLPFHASQNTSSRPYQVTYPPTRDNGKRSRDVLEADELGTFDDSSSKRRRVADESAFAVGPPPFGYPQGGPFPQPLMGSHPPIGTFAVQAPQNGFGAHPMAPTYPPANSVFNGGQQPNCQGSGLGTANVPGFPQAGVQRPSPRTPNVPTRKSSRSSKSKSNAPASSRSTRTVTTSQSTYGKRCNYPELRRRLGIGNHWKDGRDCTVTTLGNEYGMDAKGEQVALRSAAKTACKKHWNEADNGLNWATEWLKQQQLILKKAMTPKQFAGNTNRQNRVGKHIEELKLSMAECLLAWKAEQGRGDDESAAQLKERLDPLLRQYEANEPVLPLGDHHRRAHEGQIQFIVDHHPWYNNGQTIFPPPGPGDNNADNNTDQQPGEAEARQSSNADNQHLPPAGSQAIMTPSQTQPSIMAAGDMSALAAYSQSGDDQHTPFAPWTGTSHNPDDIAVPGQQCNSQTSVTQEPGSASPDTDSHDDLFEEDEYVEAEQMSHPGTVQEQRPDAPDHASSGQGESNFPFYQPQGWNY